jgi:hypothetical protein
MAARRSQLRSRFLSNGIELGPRIGIQSEPLCRWNRLVPVANGRGRFAQWGEPGWWLGAMPEPPALVPGFDDFAVMRQSIEQRVVIFASPNTLGHSAKARLVVMMMEGRSYSRLIR